MWPRIGWRGALPQVRYVLILPGWFFVSFPLPTYRTGPLQSEVAQSTLHMLGQIILLAVFTTERKAGVGLLYSDWVPIGALRNSQ